MNIDFTSLTDEQLHQGLAEDEKILQETQKKIRDNMQPILKELTRRKEEIAKERNQLLITNAANLLPFMKHTSSGCTDQYPKIYYGEERLPECAKCFVLYSIKNNYWDSDFDVRVELIETE